MQSSSKPKLSDPWHPDTVGLAAGQGQRTPIHPGRPPLTRVVPRDRFGPVSWLAFSQPRHIGKRVATTKTCPHRAGRPPGWSATNAGRTGPGVDKGWHPSTFPTRRPGRIAIRGRRQSRRGLRNSSAYDAGFDDWIRRPPLQRQARQVSGLGGDALIQQAAQQSQLMVVVRLSASSRPRMRGSAQA